MPTKKKQPADYTLDIGSLQQDNHNFNKGTEEGARLMDKSFQELGAGRSILVDRDNNIIAGNKSQEAAIRAGIKKVRVIETTGDELIAVKRTDISLDSKKGRDLALADNATTAVNLAWDETELANVADEIDGFEPPDWGVDLAEINQPLPEQSAEVHDDNFDANKLNIPKVCSKGDLWILGDHRLYCGDCTDPASFKILMDGQRADISFTSPPYNMQANNISQISKSPKVENTYKIDNGTYQQYGDNLAEVDYLNLLNLSLLQCLKHSDDVLFNIGILSTSKLALINLLHNNQDKFSDILVWNKNNALTMGLQSQRKLVSHSCELIFCFNQKGNRAFTHAQWSAGTMTNRIDTKNASDNEFAAVHHATFPIDLPAYIIKNFTDHSIIDCFGGTGTTLIAAEQLGRKCYMIELDPTYCDIIVARWQKLTGEKAQLFGNILSK